MWFHARSPRVLRGGSRPASRTAVLIAGALALAWGGLTANAGPVLQAGRPLYRTDRVLVAFHGKATLKSRLSSLNKAGMTVDDGFASPYVARVKLGPALLKSSRDRVKAALARLRADPNVRVAEPDYIRHIDSTPNDPRFTSLWNLNNTGQSGGRADADIDAPEAWDVTKGSSEVIVAVIDTGIDYNHEDLKANILRNNRNQVVGFDFVNNDSNPMDDEGHGTHVAGTIGAVGNNKKGVTGVTQHVRLMPVKVFDSNGDGSESGLIAGVDFARQQGAKIINASYGGPSFTQLELEAFQRAAAAGILICAASGNEGLNNEELPHYPASYNSTIPNILSVAATDHNDFLDPYSNYGPAAVDIAAPGTNILSTLPNNRYGLNTGTSMAAPHVAGVAALILSRYPGLSVTQVRARLLGGVDRPAGVQNMIASGRLNAARSVDVDTTAPAAPGGLAVTHRGRTALRLAWAAPGDDGNSGSSTLYEVRYSTTAITAANFASATPLPNPPVPGAAGSAESFLITGLAPDTQYSVAVRALDNGGNYSALAVAAPVRTLGNSSPVLLDDDAEGTPAFTGNGSWAITNEDHASGSRSYTDSPGTNYPANANTTLTQNTAVTPTGVEPLLTFQAHTDLEANFDFLYIEASANGGEWQRLLTLSDVTPWRAYSAPLAAFRGQPTRVRFRLQSDSDRQQNGVWVDDIRILAGGGVSRLEDTVESTPRFSGPSPWAVSTEERFSPTRAYSDSPGKTYAASVDLSLIQSVAVALSGLAPELNFWLATDLEDSFDFLLVEVTTDSGATWKRIGQFTGVLPPGFHTLSLAPFVEKSVRVRFRLMTDDSGQQGGVWIDDIRILGDALEPVATATTPAAPSGLAANAATLGRIGLTWTDNSSNEISFQVERRNVTAGETTFRTLDSVGVNIRAYTDTTVEPGSQYRYRVRAVNTAGASDPSNEVAVQASGSGKLSVSARSLGFGSVKRNKSKTKTLKLKNLSASQPLQITFTPPTAPFRISSGGTNGTIPARGTRTVKVVFKPTAKGQSRSTIVLRSSDTAHAEVTINLAGKGK